MCFVTLVDRRLRLWSPQGLASRHREQPEDDDDAQRPCLLQSHLPRLTGLYGLDCDRCGGYCENPHVVNLMARAEWQALAVAHHSTVEALTTEARHRKAAGVRHPIEDFMWTYYSQRPTQFLKWHPGAAAALEDAEEFADERGYAVTDGTARVSAEFIETRREALQWMLDLQTSLFEREPRFGCFGLHE